MPSLRDAVKKAGVRGPSISTEGLAQRFGMPPPISLGTLIRDLENLPSQLDFDIPSIVFDSGVPVGGFAHLTLHQDGNYSFSGHFHDSGATEYNVSFVLAVKD